MAKKHVLRCLLIALTSALAFLMASPAGAQQSEPIKLGGLSFLTGRFSSNGVLGARGITLALDDINSSGGVLGRQVSVDLQDTASDSGQAVSLLRRFAASDDVVAVIGPVGTPDLLALLPVAQQTTLPVMSIGSNKPLPKSTFPDDVFRVSLVESPEVLRDFVNRVAASSKISRIGLFIDRSNDSAQGEANSLLAALKGTPVQVVESESYTGGDKDFSVQIAKMMRNGVDAMFLAGTTNEDVIIISQARARGFKGPFLGGAPLTDPTILNIVGKTAAPYIIFTPFSDLSDSLAVKHFVAAYRKRYGDGQIPAYAAYAYDAVTLVCDAIKRAHSVDRSKVIQAIGSTKSFHGVTSNYSYDGKGDNLTPQSHIIEYQPSGKFVPLN